MQIFDANVFFGFWSQRRLQADLSSIKDVTAKHGVTRMLLCSLRGIFADFSSGNKETIEVCRKEANMIPVATLNPHRYLGASAEIDAMLASGVRAFRFFPEYQHWPYNFAPFHRILQQLNGTGSLVIIPARVGGHHNNGVITEIADLAGRYNRINFLITGIYYGNLAEAIVVGQDSANIYFETHLVNSPDGIEVCTAEIGAERLVYGSQTPFNYITSSLSMVTGATISEADQEQILSKNIMRILGVAS